MFVNKTKYTKLGFTVMFLCNEFLTVMSVLPCHSEVCNIILNGTLVCDI